MEEIALNARPLFHKYLSSACICVGNRSNMSLLVRVIEPPLIIILLGWYGLGANKVITRMFSRFEKTCPLREVKPLEWNLSLILGSLLSL